MTLHHVGIVVDSLSAYGEAYAAFLGLVKESEVFEDPIQKVRLQFWRDARGSLLELIEAMTPDSPVQRAAKKGGGLNHLCFEVDDIEAEVQRAREAGAVPTSEIVPAVAFSGRRVVFLFFPKLNLVEFVEAAAP